MSNDRPPLWFYFTRTYWHHFGIGFRQAWRETMPPLVTRAKHEAVLAAEVRYGVNRLREQREEHTHQVDSLRQEIANLRGDLVAANNANAKLRGQLMAEKHAQQGDE